MDVRLLICWHPGDTFQATVIAVGVGRGWHKMYPSKRECVNDLCRIGLLTLIERFDVMQRDFDINERMLVIPTIAEAKALQNAGFVESTPKS